MTGGVVAALVLALAPGTRPARADGPAVIATLTVPFGLARDAAAWTREAAASERTALWGWSTAGLGCGIYTGLVLAGRHPGPEWVASLAVVGTVAGVVGVARSAVRGHRLAGLGDRLDPAVRGGEWGADAALDLETKLGFERELFGTRDRLAAAARGALRAGVVLPVLLSGIGAYGLVAGQAELAGVCVGGAVVIGGPSVITYWGLQRRLSRVNALADRWQSAWPKEPPGP